MMTVINRSLNSYKFKVKDNAGEMVNIVIPASEHRIAKEHGIFGMLQISDELWKALKEQNQHVGELKEEIIFACGTPDKAFAKAKEMMFEGVPGLPIPFK